GGGGDLATLGLARGLLPHGARLPQHRPRAQGPIAGARPQWRNPRLRRRHGDPAPLPRAGGRRLLLGTGGERRAPARLGGVALDGRGPAAGPLAGRDARPAGPVAVGGRRARRAASRAGDLPALRLPPHPPARREADARAPRIRLERVPLPVWT